MTPSIEPSIRIPAEDARLERKIGPSEARSAPPVPGIEQAFDGWLALAGAVAVRGMPTLVGGLSAAGRGGSEGEVGRAPGHRRDEARPAVAQALRALTQSQADRLRTVGPGVSLSALAQAELSGGTTQNPVGASEPDSRLDPDANSRIVRRSTLGSADAAVQDSRTRAGTADAARAVRLDGAQGGTSGAAPPTPVGASPSHALESLERLSSAAVRIAPARAPSATVGGGAVYAVSNASRAIGAAGATAPRQTAIGILGVGRSAVPQHEVPHKTEQTGRSGNRPLGTPREPVALQAHRVLGQALAARDGTATLRLSPEHLGHLRVDLTRGEGGVTARFEASTPEAQRLLTSSLAELKAALEARGLGVERLEVRLADPHSAEAERRPGSEPGGDRPRDGSGAGHDGAGMEEKGSRGSGGDRDAADQTGLAEPPVDPGAPAEPGEVMGILEVIA